MINSIFLRRQNKLILQAENKRQSDVSIATLLKNIQELGYTLSPEILDVVSTFSDNTMAEFYQKLVKNLKKILGANVKHDPMYPNFPKQVMSLFR